jgi:uncharacterized protein (DUF3084 family)
MSLFKYILSPFVEFNEPATNTANQPTGNTGNAATVVNNGQVNTPAQSPDGSVDDSRDFKLHFNKLIEEANQKNPIFQGADLKEYLDTIAELDTIPDEQAKIKTAFNILKKTGLTKDKLLTTGREYIKLIEHDLAGIEGAFAQQYKNEVELKEQQIQNKTLELEALNKKIKDISSEIGQLTQEITQSKTQLTNNKNQFILAGEHKKSELETELQKINQYL